MDHDAVADKVHALSNLELAALLCLVAEQHCIVEADPSQLNAVARELQVLTAAVFGLSSAVLDCSNKTTVDHFTNDLLVHDNADDESYFDPHVSPHPHHRVSLPPRFPSPDRFPSPKSPLESNKSIANFVIAKNLNQSRSHVHIQALELIRNKRIYTRNAVHAAPKRFVFIALLAPDSTDELDVHLRDQIFISHYHQPEDGLPNLDGFGSVDNDNDFDAASLSSVVRPSTSKVGRKTPTFSQDEMSSLTKRIPHIRLSSEVRAYLQNIVVFMRLHRAVAGGVSPQATRHFDLLVRALAPLHGLDFVTPSLVALAARKIYPHRIVLTTPENERSLQWGSDIEAVRQVLDGVVVEDVIDDVLSQVEVPL
ncbi:hypothetical protein JOL62DRAFT_499797 [Phyllosticta paracitricarpa]|uniref:magnesium chelatase n=1 Tax=Phyllosticta paracitricarpa TaxID=2016321 RepID=A0ABR1NCZ6_9PEZI